MFSGVWFAALKTARSWSRRVAEFKSVFPAVCQARLPPHCYYGAIYAIREERRVKRFHCWDQLVAMLLRKSGYAQSAREISGALASCFARLCILDFWERPARSLADEELLQDDKTAPEDHAVCLHLSQHPDDPGLNSTDCPPHSEVPEV